MTEQIKGKLKISDYRPLKNKAQIVGSELCLKCVDGDQFAIRLPDDLIICYDFKAGMNNTVNTRFKFVFDINKDHHKKCLDDIYKTYDYLNNVCKNTLRKFVTDKYPNDDDKIIEKYIKAWKVDVFENNLINPIINYTCDEVDEVDEDCDWDSSEDLEEVKSNDKEICMYVTHWGEFRTLANKSDKIKQYVMIIKKGKKVKRHELPEPPGKKYIGGGLLIINGASCRGNAEKAYLNISVHTILFDKLFEEPDNLNVATDDIFKRYMEDI